MGVWTARSGAILSNPPDRETSQPPGTRPPDAPKGSTPPGPVRRVYQSGPEGRGDTDSFEVVTRFRVFLWSLVGAFLGFLLGVFLGVQGAAGVFVITATTAVGWAGSYFLTMLLLSGAGRATSSLYAPSGRSTPRKREYSLAESYAVRGEYDLAVATFEAAIAEAPADAEPYLRVARLYRDRIKDSRTAVAWFKRALSESTMAPGVQLRTRRELVELYVNRLGEPERAMPLLARIAAETPGSPEGAWAQGELARLKAEVHVREGSDATPDGEVSST